MTLLSRLVLCTRRIPEPPIRLFAFIFFITLQLTAGLAHAETTGKESNNGINAIAFASNGRRLAGGYENGKVVLVDLDRKRTPRFFANESGLAITGVSFIGTDNQLLSAGLDGFILFRDAGSGGKLRRFDGSAVAIRSIAVGPDEQTIVSGGEDGVIRLWDVGSGEIVQQRRAGEEGVTALAVSPVTGTIASTSASGRLSLFDTNRNLAHTTVPNQRNAATTIAFTSEGRRLLSGGADGYVRQWNPRTLANDRSLFIGVPITALSVSPDGKTVAIGTEGSSIVFWDLKTGDVARTLGTSMSFVSALAFSPDGTLVAAGGGENGELIVLNAATGEVVQSVRPFSSEGQGAESPLAADTAAGASGSGAESAPTNTSSSSSATAAKTAGAITPAAALSPNAVTALGLNPTGTLIASGLANGKIILWDRATKQQVRPFEGHNNLPVTAVSFPTGNSLSSAGRDSVIRGWNVLDGREQFKLQLHEHAVRALALSNNGQSLAAAGEDLRIGIWGGQKLENILMGHKDFINTLAFSNNNLVLASGSADDTINVWDVKAATLMRTIRGHTGDVTAVTFTINGKTLISASVDTTIRFWDVDTGQQVQVLRGPEKPVRTLAISPNEKFLVAGGDDPEIFNWDLSTSVLRKTAAVLKGRVTGVAVVPDGTVIVSGDEAGEISLFNAASGVRTGLIRTATSPEAQPTTAPERRP